MGAILSRQRFSGKVVVITGATAGIGEACARKFASEGARVVLVARGQEALDRVSAEIGAAGGACLAVPTDVGDDAALSALIERTVAEYGALDVLVNNAGLHYRGPFAERTPEELARMVDVNLRSPVLLTALALPHLRASGAGRVINVASLAGCVPTPGSAVYSATKFGLRALGYAMSEELRHENVVVSAVSPGPVDTGFIMTDLDNVTDLTFSQPIRTADQVADAVLDCAADGKLERKLPLASGYLTTIGYLFPRLARALRPMLERRGARTKARLRRR